MTAGGPPVRRRAGGDAAFLSLIVVALLGGLLILLGAGLGGVLSGHGFVWPGDGGRIAAIKSLLAHPGDPAAAYPDRPVADVPGPLAVWLGVAIAAAAALAIVVRLFLWATPRFGARRRAEQMSRQRRRERALSSAWARRADVADLIDDGDPLRWPLGTHGKDPLAAPRLESCMVLAPTGAGKTVRYVVPAVLDLCRNKIPKVIATIKGDAVWLTYAAAAASGPVWTFSIVPLAAPGGLGVLPACRWNPIAGCRTLAGARTMARWLAKSQQVEKVGGQDMAFWETLGQKLLTPMLFAAANSGRDISAVCRWVEYNADHQVQDVLDGLAGQVPADELADAKSMWAATVAREPRQKSSVYGTAEVILSGFDHPLVRQAMTGSERDPDVYSPGKLIDRRGTLYLAASKAHADEFAAVFDAMQAQLLDEVEQRSMSNGGLPLTPGLAVVLEEAANIARFRNLPYVASATRGMGLLLMSIWQDEGQIQNCYGAASVRTVMSNHLWKVYLPGSTDPETVSNLSKRVGTYTRADSSFSVGSGSSSETVRWVEEAAATVNDLQAMPTGTAIVLGPRRKAIAVANTAWFENPADRALIDPNIAAAYDALLAPRTPAKRG